MPRRWDGAAYARGVGTSLSLDTGLDALTFGPGQSLFALHQYGRLAFFPTPASTTPSWTLGGFGPSFGQKVTTLGSVAHFATANDYTIFAFGPLED